VLPPPWEEEAPDLRTLAKGGAAPGGSRTEEAGGSRQASCRSSADGATE